MRSATDNCVPAICVRCNQLTCTFNALRRASRIDVQGISALNRDTTACSQLCTIAENQVGCSIHGDTSGNGHFAVYHISAGAPDCAVGIHHGIAVGAILSERAFAFFLIPRALEIIHFVLSSIRRQTQSRHQPENKSQREHKTEQLPSCFLSFRIHLNSSLRCIILTKRPARRKKGAVSPCSKERSSIPHGCHLSINNLRRSQVLSSYIDIPVRILYPAQGIKIRIYYNKI